MTHDEMIAVIAHHKNGGKVEYRDCGKSAWREATTPIWDFRLYDYRAKPEPLVLWGVYEDGFFLFGFDSKQKASGYINTPTNRVIKKFVEATE